MCEKCQDKCECFDESLEYKIAVMQEHKAGKLIEYCSRCSKTWIRATNPAWDWYSLYYRVKPEPMEVYINVYPDGIVTTAYDTPEMAKRYAAATAVKVAAKFREVLE